MPFLWKRIDSMDLLFEFNWILILALSVFVLVFIILKFLTKRYLGSSSGGGEEIEIC